MKNTRGLQWRSEHWKTLKTAIHRLNIECIFSVITSDLIRITQRSKNSFGGREKPWVCGLMTPVTHKSKNFISVTKLKMKDYMASRIRGDGKTNKQTNIQIQRKAESYAMRRFFQEVTTTYGASCNIHTLYHPKTAYCSSRTMNPPDNVGRSTSRLQKQESVVSGATILYTIHQRPGRRHPLRYPNHGRSLTCHQTDQEQWSLCCPG